MSLACPVKLCTHSHPPGGQNSRTFATFQATFKWPKLVARVIPIVYGGTQNCTGRRSCLEVALTLTKPIVRVSRSHADPPPQIPPLFLPLRPRVKTPQTSGAQGIHHLVGKLVCCCRYIQVGESASSGASWAGVRRPMLRTTARKGVLNTEVNSSRSPCATCTPFAVRVYAAPPICSTSASSRSISSPQRTLKTAARLSVRSSRPCTCSKYVAACGFPGQKYSQPLHQHLVSRHLCKPT